jgi:hypothetical protein
MSERVCVCFLFPLVNKKGFPKLSCSLASSMEITCTCSLTDATTQLIGSGLRSQGPTCNKSMLIFYLNEAQRTSQEIMRMS